MTQSQQTAILVSIVVAIIGGYFISQRAARREKIYGGPIANVFNFIASAAMITIAPSVLCSAVVLRNEFVFTIILLLCIILTAIGSSMIFAVFENAPRKAALAKKVDRGWTEQDARTSGL